MYVRSTINLNAFNRITFRCIRNYNEFNNILQPVHLNVFLYGYISKGIYQDLDKISNPYTKYFNFNGKFPASPGSFMKRFLSTE